MAKAFTCCCWRTTPLPRAVPPAVDHSPFVLHVAYIKNQQRRDYQTKSPLFTPFAAKSGGFSLDSYPAQQLPLGKSRTETEEGKLNNGVKVQIIKRCQTCGGQGAVDCAGCKGTGKNKKNGNIFERWKCYDCQGFGLKSCPSCGQGRGLTPEQRGER